jgi:hypothetical protein
MAGAGSPATLFVDASGAVPGLATIPAPAVRSDSASGERETTGGETAGVPLFGAAGPAGLGGDGAV